MGSEERPAAEGKERISKSAGEKREPLDLGAHQEIDSQTKEGLQVHVVQEMNRKEERPEKYPLMHTAATRGVLLSYL